MIECMELLNQFLQLGLHHFWQEQKIEDKFVNIIVKMGFDMLENLGQFKGEDYKQNIFDILQICMQNYGEQMRYMLT